MRAKTSVKWCRAPREISRSPRLAHKAPVMQASVKRMLLTAVFPAMALRDEMQKKLRV